MLWVCQDFIGDFYFGIKIEFKESNTNDEKIIKHSLLKKNKTQMMKIRK